MKNDDSQAIACNGVPIFDSHGGVLTTDDAARLETIWEKAENYEKNHSSLLSDSTDVSLEQQMHRSTQKQSGKVDMDTSGFSVDGLSGTWHTIDHTDIDGHTFWLMEHDTHPNVYECIIVNEQGSPCLTRVPNEFNEHTVDLLRQELMPVTRMPDETISVDEMKSYGYVWGGMLPMREAAAVKLWDSDVCPVYRLYEDDSEGMIMDADEFRSHSGVGGIFGVEKVDWLRVLEKVPNLAPTYSEFSTEDLVKMEASAYAEYYKLATQPRTNPSKEDLEPLEKATARWEAICEELRARKQPLSDQIQSASIRSSESGTFHLENEKGFQPEK